jgi:hypothetical protein
MLSSLTRVRYMLFVFMLVAVYSYQARLAEPLFACLDRCDNVCSYDEPCDTQCAYYSCPYIVSCGDYGVCHFTTCGDNVCERGWGEDANTCSADCYCGNGVCETETENNDSCSADCYCGDGVCISPQEVGPTNNCDADCGGYYTGGNCNPETNAGCSSGQYCDPWTHYCNNPAPTCGPILFCDNFGNSCCPGDHCVAYWDSQHQYYSGFCHPN